jgi:hypothetical protein
VKSEEPEVEPSTISIQLIETKVPSANHAFHPLTDGAKIRHRLGDSDHLKLDANIATMSRLPHIGYAPIPSIDPWMASWRRGESVQRGVRCNDGTVGTDHPGGQEAPGSPEMESWLSEAVPFITDLLAIAHRVTGVPFLGAQATIAIGDKVTVAAGNACEWLAVHPCPDTAVSEQFGAVFDEFVELAERCVIAARTIGDHRGWRHHDLDGTAARATADLMIAMYASSPDDMWPRSRPAFR